MLRDDIRYEGYLRKSTESSERQTLSIPSQKNGILEKFPGINIVHWSEEKASAFIAENRPDFDAMMDRLKRGVTNGIASWQPNRLSRNALEAGKIAHYINMGIIKDIKFATYTFENTPEGVKALQYALADSQFYSANLGRDVKRGNKEKRERGWLPTSNLNGYQNLPNPNLSEEDPTEHITAIDPERYALIRKAWDLLLTGDYSVPAILDILNNQWGYRTRLCKSRKRGGTPLSRTALYILFGNIRYAGKIPNPVTGELLNGVYPAMVTIDEYNRAQEILGKHGKPRITPNRNFIYKGIATCGECGCSITAENKYRPKYNRNYIYYHCTRKRKNYRCRQPFLEEKELTRQLENFFDSFMIRKDIEECGLEAMQALNDGEPQERHIIAGTQVKALEDAQKTSDRLLDLVVNGTINEETYKLRSKETDARIKRLQEELNGVLTNGHDWRKAMAKTLDVLFNGRERFENGDNYAKREVLQSLGSDIVIKDKKLMINTYKWLEPIRKNKISLEAQFNEVRTSDLQMKNASFKGVCSDWSGILNEVRTIMLENDLQPLLR
jgi:hypothetical protein